MTVPATARPGLPEAPLSRLAVLAWRNLPLLLLIDVIVLAALLPAGIVALAGGILMAPIVAALSAGPVWLAASAILDRIAAGDDEVGGYAFAKAIAGSAAGAITALPYGFIGTLFLAALGTSGDMHGHVWQAAPLLLDTAAGTVLLIAFPAVFALRARGMSGKALWRAAFAAAAARPAVFAELALGTGIVCGIAALSHGPGLLFFMPAAIVLHCSVSLRAAERLARRPTPMLESPPR